MVTGAERANPATLKRFIYRFARFNLSETVIRPSYWLAEATLYVATAGPGRPPRASALRIVDPDTRTENPAGRVGEI
jgi:acyl-CoA synthetase (AMP-forming)/AMP-acid ligase II